ncbi:LOW QUALITY PROTEIN: solute carrier family 2, facilitated glucose transporter member 7 [Megaptera novaeangliae]
MLTRYSVYLLRKRRESTCQIQLPAKHPPPHSQWIRSPGGCTRPTLCCVGGPHPLPPNPRLQSTLSTAFGSAFQHGCNIAVVNTPHKVLKSFYNETYFERHGAFMDEKVMVLLWSCTMSMSPLGILVGPLLIGLLVDKCGRKGTLLISNVSAIPAIPKGVSKVSKASELIIFSRVALGVCAGISYSALPMHLGELAPKNLRGALGTMTEVFVIVGIFLAQIFGLQAILGNPTGWPVRLALTGVPALLWLPSPPFFPESPRSTLIQKRDEEEVQALRKLRGWADVEDEMEEMRVGPAEGAEGRLSVLSLFTFPPVRRQLVSIIVPMAGQQLSRVNAVTYYVDMIYASLGMEVAHSQVTVGASMVNIVMTVISAGAVERLGRRRLLLVGYGIRVSALRFQSTVPELSYLDIICVFAYITGHSIGPSPVPSVVRTAIFLQSSLDGAVLGLTSVIVGFAFPSVQEVSGAYSFIIFARICLLTADYIYVVIPETKGRTFMEIKIFAQRNRVEFLEKKEEITDAGPHIPSVPARETSF